MAPSEGQWLPVVFAAASRLDVIEFLLTDRGALTGVPIERPPDTTEHDAESANEKKERPPAEVLRDPKERQAQEP